VFSFLTHCKDVESYFKRILWIKGEFFQEDFFFVKFVKLSLVALLASCFHTVGSAPLHCPRSFADFGWSLWSQFVIRFCTYGPFWIWSLWGSSLYISHMMINCLIVMGHISVSFSNENACNSFNSLVFLHDFHMFQMMLEDLIGKVGLLPWFAPLTWGSWNR
jgi:hypothetical protein